MRIISNFHDYYDGIGGPNMRDDRPLYHRHTRDGAVGPLTTSGTERPSRRPPVLTPLGEILWPIRVWTAQMPQIERSSLITNAHPYRVGGSIEAFAGSDCAINARVLSLAGTLIPLWAHVPFTNVNAKHGISVTYPGAMERLWEYLDLPEEATKRPREIYAEDTAGRGDFNTLVPYRVRAASFEQWWGDRPADSHAAHLHYGAPVLVFESQRHDRGLRVYVNPNLGALFPRIASIVKPQDAYQQIDQYLGSRLAQQVDPVPERTQDLIRDAHGFDATSFRRGADTRKRKGHKP